MNTPTEPLTEERISDAAAALGRALHDDPFFVYVVPDPPARAEALPRLFAPLLRFGVLFGGTSATVTEPIAGAALWTPPRVDVTAERAQEARFGDIAEALGNDALMRYGRSMDALQPITSHGRPDELWYLMAIGVVPERQRTGLGRALLESMLAQADASGMPCYLETFTADSMPFYRSLGFVVDNEAVEPESGLPVWSLRRDPPAR